MSVPHQRCVSSKLLFRPPIFLPLSSPHGVFSPVALVTLSSHSQLIELHIAGSAAVHFILAF